MATKVRFTIARLATAACLVGAGLGMLGRLGRFMDWHVIIEGFGCCGSSCHCSHGPAVVVLTMYLSGMAAVLLRVRAVHRRLLGYGMVSLVVLLYMMFVPVIQVGKSVDPRGICMFCLLVSGGAFLAVGGTLRAWSGITGRNRA